MLTEPKGIFVCCDRWKRIRISEEVGGKSSEKVRRHFSPEKLIQN